MVIPDYVTETGRTKFDYDHIQMIFFSTEMIIDYMLLGFLTSPDIVQRITDAVAMRSPLSEVTLLTCGLFYYRR